MIKILNQQLQSVAILENAYGIGYEKSFNEIWKAHFSLPLNDDKNSYCKSFYLVEITDVDEYVGLFRIIPKTTVKNESNNTITYQCEHVLATLLNKSLFKYHQVDGLPTAESVQYLLDKQEVQHWVLGDVEFTRYFSYKWENENLLSALFSIPKPFDQDYRWTYDTQSYPWTLNLVKVETVPTCEIREGKNLIGFEIEENPMSIFNRIYPLGYGEGDNQLTIESVNGGVPYVEDAESVAENGVMETVWADKRFEDTASLKASAEALLRKWKDPIVSWRVSAADLSSITGESIDKFREGAIVRVNTNDFGAVDLRIVKELKPDITGQPWNIQLELGDLTDDIATTQSDMERRQQVNDLYSQGATNMLSYSYNDNCDQYNPAEIVFFLPDEMVRINKLSLWFETTNFRAYERAINGGGATTATSSSGGGVVNSTSSGGGVSKSTASGGGITTSSSDVDFNGAYLRTLTPYGSSTPPYELHEHLVQIVDNQLAHSHNVSIPSHSHSFDTPNHSHEVSIPAHTHNISLPDHTHAIEFGIFKLTDSPSSVVINVDGNEVPGTSTNVDNIDLIPYLSKDTEGKVTRGKHTITITPNGLGRINAQVNTQFFIQSRGGGSF